MAQPLPFAKRLQHRVEYVAAKVIIVSCGFLPLPLLRRIGAVLGWLAFRVVRIRRRIVMQHIRISFPGMDHRLAAAVAAESYQHIGRSLMEMLAFRKISEQALLDMVTIEGLGNLDEALAGGKGAILFTGHFGNWELLGAVIARCGYPLHVTDTNHTNQYAHKIINELRGAQGMRVIAPTQPVSYLLGLLSQNQFIAYLADQDAGSHGVFVDFFGRPASTLRGPALFAIRKGCPIVPGFLIREGCDSHRAIFAGPIWPSPTLAGREAVVDLTQRYTRLLEDTVRRHPQMYFWLHRRWKTKPAVNRR